MTDETDAVETATSMRPTTLIMAIGIGAVVVALILLIAGVLSPAAYWFVLWVIAAAQGSALVVQNRKLELEMAAADVLLAMLASSMVHAVRCAGCHQSAVLAEGQPDAEALTMPPGWELRNERPYCTRCVARTN